MELLSRSGVTVKGKRAVVVGRSNIVGLPVSLLLLKADATVSIVHSRTSNPESIVREADIVIAAAGQAMMVCSFTGHRNKFSVIFSMMLYLAVRHLLLTESLLLSLLSDQRRLDQARCCGYRCWDELSRRPYQEVWVPACW
jgi:hypothetical protein